MTQPKLSIVPLELMEANALVALLHRHHAPVQGHRFSIGVVVDDGSLVGAAIIGRPVARLIDPHKVLEVTRLVTDGTPNACSCLYGAAARIGKSMGYERIQTYILDSEIGVSLRASGWECDGLAGGGQWYHTDGKPRRTDQPIGPKTRWSKKLNIMPEIDRSRLSRESSCESSQMIFTGFGSGELHGRSAPHI